MIEAILPRGVAAAERFGDAAPAPAHDEEAGEAGRAMERRRREFLTGRACAREAMSVLGLPLAAIPRGPHGAPRWPAGVVGSITHCEGYRASAVAPVRAAAAIGVDAEPNAPLPERVLALIAADGEAARLPAPGAGDAGVRWDRLLFSAKEATYKAWYSLAGERLRLGEVTVEIDPAGSFSGCLHSSRRPGIASSTVRLEGRWTTGEGLLLTAIVVQADERAPVSPRPASRR